MEKRSGLKKTELVWVICAIFSIIWCWIYGLVGLLARGVIFIFGGRFRVSPTLAKQSSSFTHSAVLGSARAVAGAAAQSKAK